MKPEGYRPQLKKVGKNRKHTKFSEMVAKAITGYRLSREDATSSICVRFWARFADDVVERVKHLILSMVARVIIGGASSNCEVLWARFFNGKFFQVLK